MIHANSIRAYRQIKSWGLVGQRQLEALTVLIEAGKPLTVTEIHGIQRGGSTGDGEFWRNNLSARITELKDRGVLEEVGDRKCDVTGNLVQVVWFTGNLPSGAPGKTNNKLSRAELVDELLRDIGKVRKRYPTDSSRLGELYATIEDNLEQLKKLL